MAQRNQFRARGQLVAGLFPHFPPRHRAHRFFIRLQSFVDLARRHRPDRRANWNSFLPNEDEFSLARQRCDHNRGLAMND